MLRYGAGFTRVVAPALVHREMDQPVGPSKAVDGGKVVDLRNRPAKGVQYERESANKATNERDNKR